MTIELSARPKSPAAAPRLPGLGGAPASSALSGRPAFPRLPTALPVAAPAASCEPAARDPAELFELGLTMAAMAYHTAAVEAFEDCVAADPDHAGAWRELAELHRLADRQPDAEAARNRAAACPKRPPSALSPPSRPDRAERRLVEACERLTPAQTMDHLRARLVTRPRDVAAMRLLAHLEFRAGDFLTCWSLLRRALEIAPDYLGAREEYVETLVDRRYRSVDAVIEGRRLMAYDPANPRYRYLMAHALMNAGEVVEASAMFTALVADHPNDPRYRLALGQTFRTLGRRQESEEAYRACLAVSPSMGEAWCGLAELRGDILGSADIAAMRAHLAAERLEPSSRWNMLYALGQSLERAGDFAASFAAYDEGARIWRSEARSAGKGHERARVEARSARIKAMFTTTNLAGELAQAPPAPPGRVAPIFVVGMPRAGSTLVEQILASHPLVEGTRELSLIGDVTRALSHSRLLATRDAYPECLARFSAAEMAALGAEVIERSAAFRATDRPCFVDKRPWNWLEVGLIHLILPEARIIDIRREPMAACFAMFKQVLPDDAAFSYDLEDLGHYYGVYVDLMRHWDEVLPGKVLRVGYEQLVVDTESEIRRMLDHCGLPFDGRCLRFWETDRAIATPSAEQVRRPIFRDAVAQWRNFEPWLGPLRAALARAGVR